MGRDAFAAFQQFLSSSPEAMVLVNREREIVAANSQALELFNYAPDELIGKELEVLVPGRFRTSHPEKFESFAGARGSSRQLGGKRELFGVDAFGAEIPVEIRVSTTELDGEPFFLASLRDLTRRRMRDKEMFLLKQQAELEKARRDFLSMISHELRTPLNGIAGAHSLLERAELPAVMRPVVQALGASNRSLERILSNLLEIVDFNTASDEVTVESFSLLKTTAAVVELFAPQARERGIFLSFAHDLPFPKLVMGDPAGVRKALAELIGNALRFTASGSVAININHNWQEGADVGTFIIEVIDTGQGVAPGSHERIFEAFQQEDTSTTREHDGLGVGLSAARERARKMGGDIVLSQSSDKGSCFILELELKTSKELQFGGALIEAARDSLAIISMDEGYSQEAKMIRSWCKRIGLPTEDLSVEAAAQRISGSIDKERMIVVADERSTIEFVGRTKHLGTIAATVKVLGSPSETMQVRQREERAVVITRPLMMHKLLHSVIERMPNLSQADGP